VKRIVIIGGGVTGLGAAYALKKELNGDKNVEVLLLEKSDSTGGQIKSVVDGDLMLECGPDCFISDKPAVLEISEELGISDQLVPTRSESGGTYILTKGKLVRMPEGVMMMIPTQFKPFIGTKLLTWPGKIRAAMDVFIPRRKNLDEDETLASFVKRRLGQEILDRLAEPLVGGIHASDPDTMSLASTFPRFLKMEKDDRSLIMAMLKSKRKMAKMKKVMAAKAGGSDQAAAAKPKKRWTMFVSFKKGMQTLTDTMAEAVGKEIIRPKTEVTSIEKAMTADGRPSYKLRLKGVGDIEADAVIVTNVAVQAAEILRELDPELAGALSEIKGVSSATVNLVYKESDMTRPLDANGFLVPRVEGRRIMAGTWVSSKWPNRVPDGYVMIRIFVGGAFQQELASLSDEEMMTLVKEELNDIMGITAEPSRVEITRWMKSMPQYTIGHQERLATIRAREEAHSGLYLTGCSYIGVGVPDCLKNGRAAGMDALSYVKSAAKDQQHTVNPGDGFEY
jgi:oxygen-dependent protoporphyrinogen oxidase